MAKYLDDNGLRILWSKIKDRTTPVNIEIEAETDVYSKSESDNKYALKSDITSVYKVKGSCTTANLPSTKAVGDVWNLTDAGAYGPVGTNVVWNGTVWDPLGGIPDKATTTADGLMSKEDKTKLNGIATGAEVNQNTFSNVKVGSTTIAADSKTDTLELVAGTNITLTPDATNDKVTITSSYTDTKNTAGSTDTSSKIFLVGATSQAANPQTYSHDTAYVGTDGCLYSGSKKTVTVAKGYANGYSVNEVRYAKIAEIPYKPYTALHFKLENLHNTISRGNADLSIQGNNDGAASYAFYIPETELFEDFHWFIYNNSTSQKTEIWVKPILKWQGYGITPYGAWDWSDCSFYTVNPTQTTAPVESDTFKNIPLTLAGHVALADNATTAATATTATKLGTATVGGTTTPIYLNAGTPTALGYTIQTSVPANAVFTDTKVTQTLDTGATALPILTATGATPTSGSTYGVKYATGVTITPSTKTITATTFSGNATSATKATQDASGNVITSTYATKTELTNATTPVNIEIEAESDVYSKAEADAKYVALTGNQTIAGVKSFTSRPHINVPSGNPYVDYYTNNVRRGIIGFNGTDAYPSLWDKDVNLLGHLITETWANGQYLKLTGGTLSAASADNILEIKNTTNNISESAVSFSNSGGHIGSIGVGGSGSTYPSQPYFYKASNSTVYKILTSETGESKHYFGAISFGAISDSTAGWRKVLTLKADCLSKPAENASYGSYELHLRCATADYFEIYDFSYLVRYNQSTSPKSALNAIKLKGRYGRKHTSTQWGYVYVSDTGVLDLYIKLEDAHDWYYVKIFDIDSYATTKSIGSNAVVSVTPTGLGTGLISEVYTAPGINATVFGDRTYIGMQSDANMPTANKWWHIINSGWLGNDTSWPSQFAFPTSQGDGHCYFRYSNGSTKYGSGWKKLMNADDKAASATVADSANSVTWANVSGKPSTFAPAIGTTATTAAAGNHTHTASLATDTGTSAVTLAHGGKYKLTAGGSSVIFTMPTDNNTDTNVTQTVTASATTTYPMLFSATADATATATTTARFATAIKAAPNGSVYAGTGFFANTANSGTAGGVFLYGTGTSYGLALRQTATPGNHGGTSGDLAIYNYCAGANRGWIYRGDNGNIASISTNGDASFNGKVNIGCSGTTRPATMQYNSTSQCIEFVFN